MPLNLIPKPTANELAGMDQRLANSLTPEQRKFILDNFNISKFYNSEDEYLVLYRWKTFSIPGCDDIMKEVCNKGVADYCSLSGYSVHNSVLLSEYKSK